MLIGVYADSIRVSVCAGMHSRTHAQEDVVVLLCVRSTNDVLNQRVKVGHHIKATVAT